ncbi:hypothetical protein ACLIYP_10570 [Streptomyces nanhaiensis]|uniref:hypothetical protein n=1 Tax=Streptomyces nanhaiensis TaxID=679319 RepID=UPI00399C59BD
MRAAKALLIGCSVGTLLLGGVTAAEAMGWEHPGARHGGHGGDRGDRGDRGHEHTGGHGRHPDHSKHHNTDNSKHRTEISKHSVDNSRRNSKSKSNRVDGCQGDNSKQCTQDNSNRPVLVGMSGGGLIGLIGGSNGGTTTNGTATNGMTTGMTTGTATNGTTTGMTTNGTTTNGGAAQWCSPGFWKNNYPEAWGPTGYTGNETYSSVFGAPPPRSPQGINQNAPTDPTLFQVVDNPQWYGGDAANNVADLLSDAHPDIDYQGVRVDNCPLSANQAAGGGNNS